MPISTSTVAPPAYRAGLRPMLARCQPSLDRLAPRLASTLMPAATAEIRTEAGTSLSTDPQTWEGWGSQLDFMNKDQCILVDEHDTITGQASKKDVHVFDQKTPTGQLHRAFSVFLFNSQVNCGKGQARGTEADAKAQQIFSSFTSALQNQLLLQQRATSKITFPGVWTNTCCSHQLSGFNPSEVDAPEAISNGTVFGSKHAAIRKLNHELGIAPSQVPLEKFRYLTRLLYCAADPQSKGANPQWGEHEMDYILFIKADVDIQPNPDEVSGTMYVTLPELKRLMLPESGLKWSPWFRFLVDDHLDAWWKDLKHTINEAQPDEWTKIYDVTSRTE